MDHGQAERSRAEQVERIRTDSLAERLEDERSQPPPFPAGRGIARRIIWALTWKPRRARQRRLVWLTSVGLAVLGSVAVSLAIVWFGDF